MKFKEYLNKLNEDEEDIDESIFAIDSFPTKAHNKPLYPLDESLDVDAKRIMIDFDMVIHKYSHGWNEGIIEDPPINGVKEVIQKFRNDGYEVIILTSRLCSEFQDASFQKNQIEEWLRNYGIEVDGITEKKFPAEIYIDDRGYRFNGQWNKNTVDEIYQILNSGYKY